MQLLTAAVVINLLVGLAYASAAAPSSSSRLVRRGQESNFKGSLIMRDNVDFRRGYLPVYAPDGHEVYRFNKWYQSGFSTVALSSPKGWPDAIIVLSSLDDTCMTKSHYYAKYPNQGSHHALSYQIDPRGIKSDKWYFSFLIAGEHVNFTYHRNVFNKEGKVYEYRKNRPSRLVAKLREQTRWESWLNPGKKGARTFTLYYDDTIDFSAELATLMGLVLNRVNDCGL